MITSTLQPRALQQVESVWNVIMASDEEVQRQLFVLLAHKYADTNSKRGTNRTFLQMKGRLRTQGNAETDRMILYEYLSEKYSK